MVAIVWHTRRLSAPTMIVQGVMLCSSQYAVGFVSKNTNRFSDTHGSSGLAVLDGLLITIGYLLFLSVPVVLGDAFERFSLFSR